MNNEIAKSILRSATTPMSATALAQKVGKSKGYMIQEELESLVSSGDLIADDTGKFTTYHAARRNTVTVSNNRQNTVVVDNAIPSNERVPEGYVVSKKEVIRKSDNKRGRQITLPNNTKVFVENGYSLVVINGEPIKCVKSPASALKVIADYANDRGMTPYTVKSTVTGTIGSVDTITSNSGIIDLKVTKTNKAA